MTTENEPQQSPANESETSSQSLKERKPTDDQGIRVDPSRVFSAEVGGRANEDLEKAEAAFRAEATKAGLSDSYQSEGGAALSTAQSDRSTGQSLTRRIFLKITPGNVLVVLGGWELLTHFIELHRWLPTVSELIGWLGPNDADGGEVISQNEWSFIDVQLQPALARRDLGGIDDLVKAASSPYAKGILRALKHHLRGEIGEAAFFLRTSAGSGLLRRLPDRTTLEILKLKARVLSCSGSYADALGVYAAIRELPIYKSMKPVEMVRLFRDELNHGIQNAQTHDLYYDAKGPVLSRFDKVLRDCTQIVGDSLTSARAFDPVIGPAVFCMKEYRAWIAHAGVSLREAKLALDRQLEAIRALCEADRRLGPIRYSPLAGQHIRSGNWAEADAILAEQRAVWAEFDPNPAVNNKLEFGIHLILKGIIAERGLGRTTVAQDHWREARRVLALTGTSRFQALIAALLHDSTMRVDSERGRLQAAGLDRRLLGNEGDYYYFGLD